MPSKSLGRYCGNRLPPPVRSEENGALLIRFKSDDTVNAKGFAAVYRAISSVEINNKGPPIIKVPPPVPINPQTPVNSTSSITVPTGQTNANINHMINNDSQENASVVGSSILEGNRSGRGIDHGPTPLTVTLPPTSASSSNELEGGGSTSTLMQPTSSETHQQKQSLPNMQRQARRQRKKFPKL